MIFPNNTTHLMQFWIFDIYKFNIWYPTHQNVASACTDTVPPLRCINGSACVTVKAYLLWKWPLYKAVMLFWMEYLFIVHLCMSQCQEHTFNFILLILRPKHLYSLNKQPYPHIRISDKHKPSKEPKRTLKVTGL